MIVCKKCGKEMNKKTESGLCIDCCKADLKKYLNDNPDIKKAYKEAVEETFSPENRKKMADNIVRFMNAINQLKDRR